MAFSCAETEVPINGIWYNHKTLPKQCKINLKHNYLRKTSLQNCTQDPSEAEGKRRKQDSNCIQFLVSCWANKSTNRCNKVIYQFRDFRYM